MTTAVTELVRRAAAKDELASCELVGRFERLVRSVVRGYGLRDHDAEDVVQTTWMRAFARLETLRDPKTVAAWLAMTARRESLRALQRHVDEVLSADAAAFERADTETPEELVIQRARHAALHLAVQRLPARRARLLEAMLAAPALTHEQLAGALGMPIGSLGPTKARALDALRRDTALQRDLAA